MALYMSAGIYLVVKAARKIAGNYHAVIIMYLVTVAYINTCIMRQFMAYCIYSLALCELAEGRKGKYCVMILIAAAFHKTVLLALPLAILNGKRNLLKEVFVMVMLLCSVTFLNNNKIPGLELILLLMSDTYFNISTRWGLRLLLPFTVYADILCQALRELLHKRCVKIRRNRL